MNPYKAIQAARTFDDFLKCFSRGCDRCSLSEHDGNYPVIYRGNPKADIMLIGEGPGKVEREQGKTFVGPAGQLLDKIFSSVLDIDTNKDLFLSNIVFCRPVSEPNSGKQNYTPRSDQIGQCVPMVRRLIDIIDPRIIICCGLPAAKAVLKLNSTARMGSLEGKWFQGERPTFVMRHPSSLLRITDPKEERRIKLQVRDYMKYFDNTRNKVTEPGWFYRNTR